MTKWLMAAALVFGGCDDVETAPDASPEVDASVRVCERLSADQSHSSPIGGCCDDDVAFLCADGSGVCVVDVCVRQCSGRHPACPDGGTEEWITMSDGSNQCLCR